MLAAKIKLPDVMSIEESVEKINGLERKLKQKLPDVGWCFIEPDKED